MLRLPCGYLLALVQTLLMTVASFAVEPASPRIVAHRGLLRHAPENTLANLRACLELRLGFEFDVQRTRDGALVCIHDETLERTTSGMGKVAEKTLAELRALDAGGWFGPEFAGQKIPTVEEVLALAAEYKASNVLLAADLKAPDVEAEVAQLAEKHGVLEQVLFIGRTISEPAVRQAIRKAAPKAHVAIVANHPSEFVQALAAAEANWVYFRYLPSKEELNAVHAAKKRGFIAGATVAGNLPENWGQAAAAGIDGILTDFPLELRLSGRK